MTIRPSVFFPEDTRTPNERNKAVVSMLKDYTHITTNADVSDELLEEIALKLQPFSVYVDQSKYTWITSTGAHVRDGWECDGWVFKIGDDAFQYYTGLGHRKHANSAYASPVGGKPQLPELFDVLWAIAQDATAIKSSFEDWAGDYGYDSDSIRAKRLYEQCVENGHRLGKLFSEELIEGIREVQL
jgi:hypothetical protein